VNPCRSLLTSSFVTLACLLAAGPADARDTTSLGISVGATQTYQPSLAARVKFDVEEFMELTIGAQTRDLAVIAGTPSYGIQTSGLTAGMGFRLANLDLGAQVEASLLRKVDATGPGQLAMAQGVAFMIEPYAGIYLADGLHVGVYYPIFRPDPAIGPRAMLTLYVPMSD
jgi:hypothetical protein